MDKENFDYLLASQISVVCNYRNEEYYEYVKKKYNEIELAWQKAQIQRNKKLFNGKILHLEAIQKQENALILLCHTVEYKHYIAQIFGVDLGITPLAISGIVFYQENNIKKFYFGKRSKSVTQYPGYYEFIPSGSIDVNHIPPNEFGFLDYSKQLIIELTEELGIPLNNIKKQKTFCLIFDKVERVYDIGMELEISNTKVKIEKMEYSSVKELDLSKLDEYIKKPNVVETSRKLFEAWSSFR